jgi:hypothetical protein
MTTPALTTAPGLGTEIAFVNAEILNADTLLSQFKPGTEDHGLNGSENANNNLCSQSPKSVLDLP